MHESLPNNVQPEHATTMVPVYDTVLRGGCCRVCISWLFMEILGRAPPPSCQSRLEPTWLVVALPRPPIGFTVLCLDFMSFHRCIKMNLPRRDRQTEGDLHVACRCPLFSHRFRFPRPLGFELLACVLMLCTTKMVHSLLIETQVWERHKSRK